MSVLRLRPPRRSVAWHDVAMRWPCQWQGKQCLRRSLSSHDEGLVNVATADWSIGRARRERDQACQAPAGFRWLREGSWSVFQYVVVDDAGKALSGGLTAT